MTGLRHLRNLWAAARAVAPGLLARDRAAARAQLEERLGGLGAASTKVAQLLAAGEGRDVSDRIEPRPLADLWPAIERAAGGQLDGYSSVDAEGRAASLSQVHRATLRSGHEVALKVLLPGVAEALMSDLGALGWIGRGGAALLGRRPSGRATQEGVQAWIDAVADGLERELDLVRERELHGRARRFMEAAEPRVRVPLVWPGLSNEAVLTATWEPGEPLAAVRGWPEPDRRDAGELVARGVLGLALAGHLVHGDLHPGNVAWRRESDGGLRCVLYDFGAASELSQEEAAAWRGALAGETPPLSAAERLGFDLDVLAPIRDRLGALLEVVFEPFRSPGPFDLAKWNRAERVQALLGEERLLPRIAAPTSALPFVRTLAGLQRLLGHLDVPLDLHACLVAACPADDPPAPLPDRTTDSESSPERLLIELEGSGRADVRVNLPPTALAHLLDLVPPEVAAQLETDGVDLAALCAEAQHATRGKLLDHDLGSRRLRISLR